MARLYHGHRKAPLFPNEATPKQKEQHRQQRAQVREAVGKRPKKNPKIIVALLIPFAIVIFAIGWVLVCIDNNKTKQKEKKTK